MDSKIELLQSLLNDYKPIKITPEKIMEEKSQLAGVAKGDLPRDFADFLKNNTCAWEFEKNDDLKIIHFINVRKFCFLIRENLVKQFIDCRERNDIISAFRNGIND